MTNKLYGYGTQKLTLSANKKQNIQQFKQIKDKKRDKQTENQH